MSGKREAITIVTGNVERPGVPHFRNGNMGTFSSSLVKVYPKCRTTFRELVP
jgi:hypothetical protein